MCLGLRAGIIGLLVCLQAAISLAQSFMVSSPDGLVKATIKVIGGDLFYNLTRSGSTVIADSRLGVVLDQNGSREDTGDTISSLTASGVTSFDQTYATIGLHSIAENDYDSQTFTIPSPAKRPKPSSFECSTMDWHFVTAFQAAALEPCLENPLNGNCQPE